MRGITPPRPATGRSLSKSGAVLLASSILVSGVAAANSDGSGARSIDAVCDGRDQSTFEDVEGHAHERAIRCMAGYGLTEGADGGESYGPSLPVSRGQMASFIARFIEEYTGEQLPAGDPGRFSDVPAGHAHGDNIASLAAIEVVEGRPSGSGQTYAPSAPVTRDQMASFIARSLSYLDNGEVHPVSFTAEPASDWYGDDEGNRHEANIDAIASVGIVEGYADSTYRPAQRVLRGQMASFVMRAFDFAVAEGLGGEPATPQGGTTTPPPSGGGGGSTPTEPGPGVVNTSTGVHYVEIQEAIDAAEPQDVLDVRGDFAGLVVVDEQVSLRGVGTPTLTGTFDVTADGVTIAGFAISEYSSELPETAGVYLRDVEDVTLSGNTFSGEGLSRGVATTGTVTGSVTANDFVGNTTGVFNNAGSKLTIHDNVFTRNTAGVATDSDGVTVTQNEFVDNGEGIGLGGASVTVTGNEFGAGNLAHVCDYTDGYTLADVQSGNSFGGGVFQAGDCLFPDTEDPLVVNEATNVRYESLQAAVDAATSGQSLVANGRFEETVLVDETVTIEGVGTVSLAGSFRVIADAVAISGFHISAYATIVGETAGIYLQDVADISLAGNHLDGGDVAGSRGILTTGTVTGTVTGGTFVDNATGVFNNPGSQLTVTGNTFEGNTVGLSSDSGDGVTVTGNQFSHNGEGIGLGGAKVTVEGNTFDGTNADHLCDYTGGYTLSAVLASNTFGGEVFESRTCLLSYVPVGTVVNTAGDTYATLEAAIEDADPGATLTANGAFEGSVLVDRKVTIEGIGTTLLAGSFHVTADDVAISGFGISGYATNTGETAGVYLQGVSGVSLTANRFDGGGVAGSRGILTAGTVTGTVAENTFAHNTTGVFNNPGSQLVVDDNTFAGNGFGLASDSADGVRVTNNEFRGNGEAVGLGGEAVTVIGNVFGPDNTDYVCDYTGERHDSGVWLSTYSLHEIEAANTFEGAAYVREPCLTSEAGM